MSHIKSIPTHEKLLAVGKKKWPEKPLFHLIFAWVGVVALGLGCSSVFIKIFACFPTQQNVVNPKHPTEVLSRNWCPCSGHSRRVRGVLVLERLTKRSSGEPGADAGADCLEPPEYGYGGQAIRVASSRAGGVASHQIDGAAMDVLMEYVGWRSSVMTTRFVVVTASAVASCLFPFLQALSGSYFSFSFAFGEP